MNCPKCGKPIEGLNCECGFTLSSDKVNLIGLDAQEQVSLIEDYLKVELQKISDEEVRKKREFEKEIAEPEVKRVEERQLHKQKSTDDESTVQVYKRAQYVNDNRIEQSSGTEVKHNSVDLGFEDVQKRLEQTRDELLADLEKRKPAVLNRTGGNSQQNNAENKSGSVGSSKGNQNDDGRKTKPKLIYVIAVVVLIASTIGFAFHNGVLPRKNALSADGGGWGDSDGGRPSYTIDEINEGVLGDTITFNSISDGDIGDEKDFVAVKVAGEDVSEWNANSIKVKDGETYTVRMFVHNNNPKGHDAVARDVKARFCLPEGYSKEQSIMGYLDSSNASPSSYCDGVTFTSDKQFFIEYVAGSARFNNNEFDDKVLDDEIISAGTNLGYGSLNGRMPGCYEYSGVATIDIIVHEGTWGPQDRAVYTMDSQAAEPTFNSITDNPSIGDERNFVRIGEINPDQTDLTDSVELKKGKQYLVYIYIHNNASATYNDKEHNRKGVAANTRLSTAFPDTVNADETGVIKAKIMSDNSNPSCVWDTAMVITKEESISLKYVAGSAKIYNDWDANNTVLPSTLFSNEGALVGLNELNGVIPGCEEYHSVVTYVLEAE